MNRLPPLIAFAPALIAQTAAVVRGAARSLLGCDGITFVVRDVGEMCHYVEEDAVAPLWKGQKFPMSVCVSGWVMTHGATVIIPDIYADPRVPHDAYRPTFVKSMAMVPVGKGYAAIGAYWAQPHAATQNEVEMLQAMAESAGLALTAGTSPPETG